MFPGVPKYGQTSALRVAKDDKEKWRARTVLIWDPASVRSVAEKLSQEEDFSIEDEEFWEMFQKKHVSVILLNRPEFLLNEVRFSNVLI